MTRSVIQFHRCRIKRGTQATRGGKNLDLDHPNGSMSGTPAATTGGGKIWNRQNLEWQNLAHQNCTKFCHSI